MCAMIEKLRIRDVGNGMGAPDMCGTTLCRNARPVETSPLQRCETELPRSIQRELPRQLVRVLRQDQVDSFADVDRHRDLRALVEQTQLFGLLGREVDG